MAEHIAYDTDKRIIYVTTAPVDGEVSIDIKEHLYSDMKVDWQTDTTLNKFKLPIRSVGGDALPGSKELGATFFLDSNWKIRPYEANHIFRLNGNLYSEDGTSVMIPPIGNYQVLAEMFVSNLSDSTIQQLAEIEQASFEGAITVDFTLGQAGTDFPLGTRLHPSNNWADAYSISQDRGLPLFFVIGNAVLNDEVVFDNYTFFGESPSKTHITINPIASVYGCEFYECHLLGTLDGDSVIENGLIDNLNYIEGSIRYCSLDAGTISLTDDNTKTAHIIDCVSGVPGTDTPIIDMVGDGAALAIRNYNGGIKLINKTGNSKVSIDLNSGQAILDNTVVSGQIVCRGVGKLIDINGNHIQTGTWNGCEIVNETTGVSLNDISFISKWVYINTELAVNGNGKESSPFNNISDAVDFAEAMGYKRLMFLSNATLERTLKNFTIEGIGLPTIDFNGQNVDKSEFFKVKLTGHQVGSIVAREVVLLPNLTGVYGVYKECGIAGDIEFADNSITTIASISTLFVGTPAPYKIDLGATNTNVVVNLRKVSGALEVMNVNTPTKFATFEFNGGKFIAGATNNNGVVGVAGLPDSAVDVSLATSTVILDGVFPSANTILNTDVSCV